VRAERRVAAYGAEERNDLMVGIGLGTEFLSGKAGLSELW